MVTLKSIRGKIIVTREGTEYHFDDLRGAFRFIEGFKSLETDQSNAEIRRSSKSKYYLDIAAAISKRSTCLRRQYGAIIVKNDEIIATGYNGSPRGEDNCCDKGYCWREANNIPHGQQYEKCVAVHAEMNAIISAARKDIIGSVLYLAGFENGKRINAVPCAICSKLIKNAGISMVINSNEYLGGEGV